MVKLTALPTNQTAPRFLRASSAPAYLGMCRDEFNKTVRPYVREFPIGKQGIAFDRHELDHWADTYADAMAIEKQTDQDNNRPRSERQRGTELWREKQSLGSTRKEVSGKSTRSSGVSDFAKALELVTGKKPSST